MTDEEFDAYVTKSRHEMEQRQADLTNRFGLGTHDRWSFDEASNRLTFSDAVGVPKVEATAVQIGSYSGRSQTWQWAWANRSVLEKSRTESGKLKKLFEKTGMEVFRLESFEADEEMAWELAAMAVTHLRARGCYRAPAGHLSVFLAITSIRHAAPSKGVAGTK